MKKFTLILVLVTASVLSSHGQQLSGKVFMLGETQKDCSIQAQDCDCCMSELYFITEQQFAMVHYCGAGKTYTSGTYKIESKVLTLQFKQGSVYKSFDTGESSWEKTTIKPETFALSSCENGTPLLINKGTSVLKYGLPLEWEKINEIVDSGEWKTLKGK